MDRPAALVIEGIVVKRDRIVCDVRVADPRSARTDAVLAARVIERFPQVVHHSCVNDHGDSFGDAIARTTLPHLLEHVVIDIQTGQARDLDAVYVGTTEWRDEATGLARIEVSYSDDLVALRSFSDAVSFLNAAVVE